MPARNIRKPKERPLKKIILTAVLGVGMTMPAFAEDKDKDHSAHMKGDKDRTTLKEDSQRQQDARYDSQGQLRSAQQMSASARMPQDVKVTNDVIGQAVRTRDGQQIGHVSDLLIDLDAKRVAMVVVELDDQRGENRHHVLPWSQVQTDQLSSAIGYGQQRQRDDAGIGAGAQVGQTGVEGRADVSTGRNRTGVGVDVDADARVGERDMAQQRTDAQTGVQSQTAQRSGEQQGLTLKIDRSELDRAESFEANQWPDLDDRQWAEQTYERFGEQPYWQQDEVGMVELQYRAEGEATQRQQERVTTQQQRDEQQRVTTQQQRDEQQRMTQQRDQQQQAQLGAEGQFRLTRASELRGVELQDRQGEQIGSIEDLVIDTQQGSIAYAIVDQSQWLGLRRSQTAVPFGALTFTTEEGGILDAGEKQVAQINADSEQLRSLAVDDASSHNYADEAWARRIHREFNEEPYWQVPAYVSPSQRDAQQQQNRGDSFRRDGQQQQQNRGDTSMQNQQQQSNTRTLYGEVKSVEQIRVEGSAEMQTKISIETQDGQEQTVYLGSQNQLSQQNLDIQEGSTVQLHARQESIEGEQAFRAHRIIVNGQQYNLGAGAAGQSQQYDAGRTGTSSQRNNLGNDASRSQQQQRDDQRDTGDSSR